MLLWLASSPEDKSADPSEDSFAFMFKDSGPRPEVNEIEGNLRFLFVGGFKPRSRPSEFDVDWPKLRVDGEVGVGVDTHLKLNLLNN